MANRGTPGFDPAKLRQHREAAGLSQSDLARRAQLRRGYVSKYEVGLAKPDPDRLAIIAEALGLAPMDLVDREQLGFGLASLRVAAGLKQSDVADRAGPDMPVGKYRMIEQGKVARLTHADTASLAQVFGVDDDVVRTAHDWDVDQRT